MCASVFRFLHGLSKDNAYYFNTNNLTGITQKEKNAYSENGLTPRAQEDNENQVVRLSLVLEKILNVICAWSMTDGISNTAVIQHFSFYRLTSITIQKYMGCFFLAEFPAIVVQTWRNIKKH